MSAILTRVEVLDSPCIVVIDVESCIVVIDVEIKILCLSLCTVVVTCGIEVRLVLE